MLGNLLLGLVIGIQWLIAALMVIGLHPRPHTTTHLTEIGKYLFRPENDIPIYIFGSFVTILLIVWFTFRKSKPKLKISTSKQVWLSSFSLISFLLILFFLKPLILYYWIQPVTYIQKIWATFLYATCLLIPSVITLGIYFKLKFNFFEKDLKNSSRLAKSDLIHSNNIRFNISDFFIWLFVFTLVYIPQWKNLAGHIYVIDQFHHWDGFVMRATLAFTYGLALGKDMYIQYGVGWPLVFTFLNKIWPLSYENIIGLSLWYACFYYIGVYILLKLLTKNRLWSVIGIGLILHFQLFLRDFPYPFLWEAPSSTLLRFPFDVWFFMCLLIYIVGQKRQWLWLASVSVGLALLFGFDTGLYLLITWILFLIIKYMTLSKYKSISLKKNFLTDVLLGFSFISLILFLGFEIASWGQATSISFWKGLVEGIIEFGSGISFLPIASLQSNNTLLIFTIYLLVYLGTVGFSVIKFFQNKFNDIDLYQCCLSLYGMALLLIFVGRSHPLNIFYISIPFWILSIWNISNMLLVKKNIRISKIIVFIFGMSLLSNPAFKNYPNVFWTVIAGWPHEQECLIKIPPDICGLSQNKKFEIESFEKTLIKMKQIKSSHQTLAIFDKRESIYYLQLGQAPFFRFEPSTVFTKKQLIDEEDLIFKAIPDYIFFQKNQENLADVWSEIHETVKKYGKLEETIGDFEIWKRN